MPKGPGSPPSRSSGNLAPQPQDLTYNVWLCGIHCIFGVFRQRHLQGKVRVDLAAPTAPTPLQRREREKRGRGNPANSEPFLGLSVGPPTTSLKPTTFLLLSSLARAADNGDAHMAPCSQPTGSATVCVTLAKSLYPPCLSLLTSKWEQYTCMFVHRSTVHSSHHGYNLNVH